MILEDILEKAADGICVFHSIPDEPYARFTHWNPRMTEITGYTIEEINNLGWIKSTSPDQETETKAVERMSGMREGYDIKAEEWNILTKDKSKKTLSISTSILKEENGEIHFLAVMQDITEKKQNEEHMTRLQAQFAHALEMAQLAPWEYDVSTDSFTFNDYFYKIFGTSAGEVGGYKMRPEEYAKRFLHPDDIFLVREETQKTIETTDPNFTQKIEHRIKYSDGTTGYMSVKIFIEKDDMGKTIKSYGVNQDITEHKKMEEDLRRTKERLESLWNITKISDSDIKTISEHILAEIQKITESEYAFFGFLTENEKTMVMHSWSKETMKDCQIPRESLHFPIENAGIWANAIKERRTFTINDYNTDQPGKKGIPGGHVSLTRLMVVPLILNNKVHSIAAVANKPGRYTREDDMQVESFLRNVQILIDRKKHEEEKSELTARLQQAQKMESIGTLAGGIAHDFNNILTPIILHAEMVSDDLSPDDPLQQDMNEILKAARRAKDLVLQILTVARKKSEEKVVLKSSLVVKEAVKFLRSTIPATIEIEYSINTEQDTILADPVQLNQIVMNLCTNAAHAMKDKGGLLKIIIDNETLSNEKLSMFPGLKPGKYLKLSVEDTGTGIAPEIMNKIFEPYYSTKGVGEGTGLGLSIIHGIAKNYGGDIDVKSVEGEGAAFHVYLPLIEAEVTPQIDLTLDLPKGSEWILFVDDEKSVVDASRKMLERLGYRVQTETDPTAALKIFYNDPEAFDLVITDMTMPKITGIEFFNELKKSKPDTPVIICTGFSDRIDEKVASKTGVDGFINKPVTGNEIAQIIRDVLDKKINH